jgi:iduronate 2-sulfatase
MMKQTKSKKTGPAARAVLGLLGLAAATAACDAEETSKPNVLFIAVDDLRPLLGCYGNVQMKTPHIDRLARQGVLFERAYCQFAACGPTRASVLTGMYPEQNGVFDQVADFRKTAPDVVSLPEHFKENGYMTVGMGKVFHHGHQDSPSSRSWSRWIQSLGPGYQLKSNIDEIKQKRAALEVRKQAGETFSVHQEYILTVGPATEAADVPDSKYPDGMLADAAIKELNTLREQPQPFFLALGFRKPHLPLIVPEKYWDLYDPEKLVPPEPRKAPVGAPLFHPHDSYELRSYGDIPKSGEIPGDIRRRVAHGYYAACSFIDAQVGRVLDELDRLGLSENTVIVLWGDHGFHLGENGIIAKDTNYEASLHAPLIISGPVQQDMSRGGRSKALVEFVDMFPTLCDLAGLPVPEQCAGDSLAPLLKNPAGKIKEAVFSVNRRSWQHDKTGYAMTTDRYRYIRWEDPAGEIASEELYDYEKHPAEVRNLIDNPEYSRTLSKLRKAFDSKRPRPLSKETTN